MSYVVRRVHVLVQNMLKHTIGLLTSHLSMNSECDRLYEIHLYEFQDILRCYVFARNVHVRRPVHVHIHVHILQYMITCTLQSANPDPAGHPAAAE